MCPPEQVKVNGKCEGKFKTLESHINYVAINAQKSAKKTVRKGHSALGGGVESASQIMSAPHSAVSVLKAKA